MMSRTRSLSRNPTYVTRVPRLVRAVGAECVVKGLRGGGPLPSSALCGGWCTLPPLRVSRPARARPRSRWTVWAIVSCFPRGCLWAPTHPHPGLHGLTGDLTMLTRRPLLLLVDYVRVTLEGGSAAPTTHSSRRPKIRWPRPSGRLRTGFGERSIAWPLQLL